MAEKKDEEIVRLEHQISKLECHINPHIKRNCSNSSISYNCSISSDDSVDP